MSELVSNAFMKLFLLLAAGELHGRHYVTWLALLVLSALFEQAEKDGLKRKNGRVN